MSGMERAGDWILKYKLQIKRPWQIREGTILVCPLANQSISNDGNTVILNPEQGNTANKRMKTSEKFVTNQPELVKPD